MLYAAKGIVQMAFPKYQRVAGEDMANKQRFRKHLALIVMRYLHETLALELLYDTIFTIGTLHDGNSCEHALQFSQQDT